MMIRKADAAYPFPMIGGGKGGGGSSGGGTTQTVQKADPWSGQQPYLTDVFGQAQSQYGQGPMEFFPGQTFSPLSAETELALSGQANRAMMGSPLLGAAQNEITSTMQGDYLNGGNPAYAAMAERAISPLRSEFTNTIIPGIESKFSAAGRYGSPALANTMGRATDSYMRSVGDVGAQLSYNNYENERTNQMRGAMFAPQLAQQDYADMARLAEVGAAREDFTQQGINDQMARWNYEQQEPWQRLGLYSNLVQGMYGNQTQTTQTLPRRSIGAGMLGGGLGGGALGYMMSGGDPLYTAGGAGLGGLLGLF